MGLNDRELTPAEIADMRGQVVAGARRLRPAGAHRTTFVATSIAVVLVAALAVSVLTLTSLFGRVDPAPVTTPTPSPTASPTPTPTIPPAVIDEPVVPTCENTSTDEFRSMMMMEGSGRVSWQPPSEENSDGFPFGVFPGGAPDGMIVCVWGAGPDVGTDNNLVFAWAPLDAEQRPGAEQAVVAAGYDQRVESPEGVYFVDTSSPGYDASYLFTGSDVRWAESRAQLPYIKAPEESG